MGCDNEILKELNNMQEHGKQSVHEIEKMNLLSSCTYYHERLVEPQLTSCNTRKEWHQKGQDALKDCELVFLDPDNGLVPKSVSRGSNKSIKYVFSEEIIDYYNAGHSVFYSHRTREQIRVYLSRFADLFAEAEKKKCNGKKLYLTREELHEIIFFYCMRSICKRQKKQFQNFYIAKDVNTLKF